MKKERRTYEVPETELVPVNFSTGILDPSTQNKPGEGNDIEYEY